MLLLSETWIPYPHPPPPYVSFVMWLYEIYAFVYCFFFFFTPAGTKAEVAFFLSSWVFLNVKVPTLPG